MTQTITQEKQVLARELNRILHLMEEARAQMIILRNQLVACGVAARMNTESNRQHRLPCTHSDWSASYEDVCDAVDREIALRAEVTALTNRVAELEAKLARANEAADQLHRESLIDRKKIEALEVYARNRDNEIGSVEAQLARAKERG